MSRETSYADWIAVDWGTSRVRAWAMRNNEPVADASANTGMGRLAPNEFEPALLALIEPWLGTGKMPVVACGMVGSKQGWAEAAYTPVPAAPVSGATVRPKIGDARLDVSILPGLSQAKPTDVMRGEETQIAGFLAESPNFDGILCLPGTHTKWVHVSAGEVVSFRTFMSGELFDLLSNTSVLKHSIDSAWDETAFLSAFEDGMAKPQALAGELFSMRAGDLLGGHQLGVARARLSGLLLGVEFVAARPYWLGQRLVLVGSDALSAHYATAMASQGAEAERADVTRVTLAGLSAAYAKLSAG